MSGIGRRSILLALGKILQIEDVKQAPPELDTSSVKVTAPLDMGWAGCTPWVRSTTGLSIAGAGNGTFAWPVVGDQAQGFTLAIPAAARKRDTAGEENVVLGLSIQFAFTGPGAVTDVNTEVEIYGRFRPTFAADPVPVSPYAVPAFMVDSNRLRYVWAFPDWLAKVVVKPETAADNNEVYGLAVHAGKPLWVPAGAALDIVVDHMGAEGTPGGVVFAAGTTVDLYAWGVSCPKGFKPPGL